MLFAVLLSYISTVSFFLFGTNDTLFIICLAIFFIETYTYLSTGKMNFHTLAFLTIIISMFTRQMIVFYLPVIGLSIYYLRHYKPSLKSLLLAIMTTIVLLFLNLPSIINEKRLSYDNKKAPEGLAWSQIGYLTTIESNAGLRKEGDHPNWNDVREYLNKYGENSLPRTYGESIFFNFKLTLQEFPEDFFVAIKGCIRQIGLFLFIPLLALFFEKSSYKKNQVYAVTIFWTTLAIFSFVILAIVELRWMGALSIFTIVVASDTIRKTEFVIWNRKLTTLQLQTVVYSSYVMLSLYGIITYSKLIL
jgi:hypothetical protein